MALLSNDAPPTDEPVKVAAVIVAASPLMAPPSASVIVPVPASTVPVTVRLGLLERVRLPLPVENGPSAPIWLATLLNDAPPTDEPDRVAAVIVAASAEMAPPSARVSVPVPTLTAPVTVKLGVLARVRSPFPVAKAPSVPIWLPAELSDAAPTDEPVRVPAVTTPPVWLIVPAEIKSAVPPPALTAPLRIMLPVVLLIVAPVALTTPEPLMSISDEAAANSVVFNVPTASARRLRLTTAMLLPARTPLAVTAPFRKTPVFDRNQMLPPWVPFPAPTKPLMLLPAPTLIGTPVGVRLMTMSFAPVGLVK